MAVHSRQLETRVCNIQCQDSIALVKGKDQGEKMKGSEIEGVARFRGT
jgi:hypothetical protein